MDDEPDEVEPDELDPEDDAEPIEPYVVVEISGLSVYTHHGVDEAERRVGQRLVFDVSFEVGSSDAILTDNVEDTVDYADAAQQILLAAQERSYRTLERVCSVVADRLMDRYEAESVSVRASKPEPPMPLSVEEVSVEVRKERPD
ncbi:MAG: dihydroneopterin aldolase [Thermoleophilaceae bacterium]|jgi:dihydroneopterin aldolase